MAIQKYEYEFVRLDPSEKNYQDTIRQYANKGWRLVQIFTRIGGIHGIALYIELVSEREIAG